MQQLAIALILFLAASAHAQDLSGTWVGAIEANDFLGAVRLDLNTTSTGSTITLLYAGDKRSGNIDGLKVDGNTVSFEGKMQPSARFVGKIDRDRISGTFDILSRTGAVSGTGVWDARRVDPAVIAPIEAAPTAAASELQVLPAPTGELSVGRQLVHWTDGNRSEPITSDPSDKRRVFVQVWYPAEKKNKSKTAVYFPFGDLLTPGDYRATVKTHAVENARFLPSNSKYPLVIFSPGLGSSPFGYTAIIENLVSHGYVVASINHAYDTGAFKTPDGQTIMQSPEWERQESKDRTPEQRKQFFDERRFMWVQDSVFVVNKLEESREFSRMIDFDRIGMAGHSFGGQASSVVCATDARFKACANLDGLAQGNTFLPDEKGNVLKQPYMYFTKAAEVTDYELKLIGLSRTDYRSRERSRLIDKWNPSFKTRLASLQSGAYLLVFPGIRHNWFGDLMIFDKNSTLSADARVSALNAINDYILAFFDKFLKGKQQTLLDTKTKTNPEVFVQFLRK